MERIYVTQSKAVAANASGRLTFAPPTAASKWRLLSFTLIPNETSAVHATDFADLTLKKVSTALAAVRSTNSGTGTLLTQGTSENPTLTAVGADLECTQAAPMHLLIDATPGAGVAVDIAATLVFEVMVA